MFFTLISTAILLLTCSNTFAAPQTDIVEPPISAVCASPDFGPFKLFARREYDRYNIPVRLLSDPTATVRGGTYMEVNTNATCEKCGYIPPYWQLKGMNLIAMDASAASTYPGYSVNLDVASGTKLDFIRAANPYNPIYCAETSGGVAPPLLSLHGTPKLFSMCAYGRAPTTSFSVIFKRPTIMPQDVSCYPVTLIIQPIGIVPT